MFANFEFGCISPLTIGKQGVNRRLPRLRNLGDTCYSGASRSSTPREAHERSSAHLGSRDPPTTRLARPTQRATHSPSLECDLEIHLLRGGLIHTHRRMEGPGGNHTHSLFRKIRAGDVQSLQCGRLSVLTDPAMHPHCYGLI